MSAGGGLCRDCLASSAPAGARRCPACASPRLLVHPERDDLAVAHVDCDAFYATIEKRDDPSLVDKPLIVGGGRRGVVSTCCYIARTFGVRSAMPMFKALAACPDAVVIKPDMAKYVGVGRQVRALMRELTPLVEPLSIDEAFLDLAGTERLHHAPPATTLARFALRVEREIGVTVSIGLSYCKFLAKVASDLDKPRGFRILGRGEAKDFLASQPVRLIWGVGAASARRLAEQGLATLADVQARTESDMVRAHGPEGGRLWRLAQGIDERRVNPVRETKSISAETTFDADHADVEFLTRTLLRLCERVSTRAKAAELAGSAVTLKLKTADFRIRTRARSGLAPTQLAGRIFAAARPLLEKEATGARFRLIGVGLSGLVPAEGADAGGLLDADVAREKAAETAIDALRKKFGDAAIVRGRLFQGKP